MKKLFGKVLAIAIAFAMVIALGTGISFTKSAQADSVMTLSTWEFMQAGVYNSKTETAKGNYYYLDKVTMNDTGEVIDGWLRDDGSGAGDEVPQACTKQTLSSSQADTGFKMVIDHSGWDRDWKNIPWRINPWAISASVKSSMNLDHRYKVTFKAKANKAKNCFVSFNTKVGDYDGEPWDPGHGATLEEGSDSQLITIGTVEKEYTYIFYDYVGGQELTTSFMLGSFGAAEDGHIYDFGGNDITGTIDEENGWFGNVTVSNFKIEDLDPDKPTIAPKPTEPPETGETEAPTVTPKPTQAPTVKPTPAKKTLGKVTKVKIKNPKKKTIKVSWKKVKNAKSYQVKVGKKTYPAKKTSRKIKNKKFKKGKTVKVKVRAIAKGYKAGPWSKTAKKKLKK